MLTKCSISRKTNLFIFYRSVYKKRNATFLLVNFVKRQNTCFYHFGFFFTLRCVDFNVSFFGFPSESVPDDRWSSARLVSSHLCLPSLVDNALERSVLFARSYYLVLICIFPVVPATYTLRFYCREWHNR